MTAAPLDQPPTYPRPSLSPGEPPVIELRNVSKSYGRVRAVREVSFAAYSGRILGIAGDNGAGKSTLMNIVSGAIAPTSGELHIDGQLLHPHSVHSARIAGIEMIYQDLGLADNLSITENIFLGRELTRSFAGLPLIMRKAAMKSRARAVLADLGIDLHDLNVLVDGLSGGQRQMVAVARALVADPQPKVMIMDEPTAALGTTESAAVHDLVLRLRDAGHAVILISHRIPELLELADDVLIMKGGRRVHLGPTSALDVESCVQLIVSGTPEREVA